MGQLSVVNFSEIQNWTKIDAIRGCRFLNILPLAVHLHIDMVLKTLPLAVYLHIGMVLKTLPLAVSCQYSLIGSDNFKSTFFSLCQILPVACKSCFLIGYEMKMRAVEHC